MWQPVNRFQTPMYTVANIPMGYTPKVGKHCVKYLDRFQQYRSNMFTGWESCSKAKRIFGIDEPVPCTFFIAWYWPYLKDFCSLPGTAKKHFVLVIRLRLFVCRYGDAFCAGKCGHICFFSTFRYAFFSTKCWKIMALLCLWLRNQGHIWPYLPIYGHSWPYMAIVDQFFGSSWKCSFD